MVLTKLTKISVEGENHNSTFPPVHVENNEAVAQVLDDFDNMEMPTQRSRFIVVARVRILHGDQDGHFEKGDARHVVFRKEDLRTDPPYILRKTHVALLWLKCVSASACTRQHLGVRKPKAYYA